MVKQITQQMMDAVQQMTMTKQTQFQHNAMMELTMMETY